ncbi:MAG: alpha/beta hydrolase [Acidimicrobiia bacterium]
MSGAGDGAPLLRIDGYMPLVVQRRAAEDLVLLATEPAGARYHDELADTVACLWAEPPGPRPPGVVQYLHGGYAMCSLGSHRRIAGHVACVTGMRVLLVGYRLAPEHPFPAAIDDSVTVYRWLLDQGIERIVLAGESAGGGIVVATLLALRDTGVALPAAAAVMSPWVDMTVSGPSMETNAPRDLFVSADGLRALARHVLQDVDPRDPLASPILADLSGLPALLVQVAADEVLLDDARRLAAVARAAGVEVTYDCTEGMQHAFQLAAGNLAAADQALARLGEFVRGRADDVGASSSSLLR